MGIIETLFKNPRAIETTVIMGFGCLIWFLAIREMTKKEKIEDENKVVANVNKASQSQAAGPSLMLTYITKEQILELTAEQVKGIPEEEVEKLPTAMKDMFKRRRNEVLLADKAKNNQ